MKFKDILEKGITFSSNSAPVSPENLAELETIINGKISEEYRDFLLHTNGGEINCHFTEKDLDGYLTLIHWPKGNGIFNDEEYSIVQYFFDIDRIISYYNEWKEFLPEKTFIFAMDPGSTYYLIGFGPENRGKIYAWRIEDADAMEEPDTEGYAYLGFIADSFVEFILSLQDISLLAQRRR